MTPRTSIIIPVYMVERTLDRCVESIAGQTDQSVEIILVDDGSPDGCPALCDRWKERDGRIRVVHKKNGGLSSARNAGIDMARGKYLMFVDSDDYLEPESVMPLTRMLDDNSDYDILEFPICSIDNGERNVLYAPHDRVYRDKEDFWLTTQAYVHAYACNKIYRRRVFDNVRYPEGVVFEDIHTLPLLLDNARTVATTDKGMYCYVSNADGITATADGTAWRMLLDAHMKVWRGMDMAKTGAADYYMHILNIQIYCNELSGEAPRLETRRPKIRTLERRFILKGLLLHILGVRGLCAANRWMRKVIRRDINNNHNTKERRQGCS